MITGRVARMVEVPHKPAACSMTKGRIQNRAQSVHYPNTRVSVEHTSATERSRLQRSMVGPSMHRRRESRPGCACWRFRSWRRHRQSVCPVAQSRCRLATSLPWRKKKCFLIASGAKTKINNLAPCVYPAASGFEKIRLRSVRKTRLNDRKARPQHRGPYSTAKAERVEPAAADAEDSALSARGLGPRFFLKAPQSKHMLSSFSLSPGSFLVKRKAVCAPPPAIRCFLLFDRSQVSFSRGESKERKSFIDLDENRRRLQPRRCFLSPLSVKQSSLFLTGRVRCTSHCMIPYL